MIIRKTAAEIEAMRAAGRVVALAHGAIRAAAEAGVSLLELDEIAADVLREHGATSPFKGYQPHFAPTPFPGVICASVNDVVVHGIPSDQRVTAGDVVSIDLGATVDGWVGDAARTFIIGAGAPDDVALVEHTDAALAAGIAAAVPGGRMGDIASAVGTVGRRHGYGIPKGWGGHGIGRDMHEEPTVPNEGPAGRGLRLKAGLVIAIEPMFMAGGQDGVTIDADGWTIRSSDGSRAAHSEDTLAITDDGPQVLTAV